MTLIECELYQYIFQINSQKVSDIFCCLYTQLELYYFPPYNIINYTIGLNLIAINI